MITAILVMAVIVLIATVSLTLSTHTTTGSATDRSRALAVHAAEAGIDRFLLYLDETPSNVVECNPLGVQPLPTSPGSQYTTTAKYLNEAESDVGCIPSSLPASAVIRSVGSVGGVTRTMEALVRLTATGGSFGNEAIFSDGDPTFSGNSNVLGSSESPDKADIYSNGDVTLTGTAIIWGSVRSRKSVTISGSFQVKRDVYALGNGASSPATLKMSGGATIWGSAYNSTGSILVSGNSSQIKGNATACHLITASAGTIRGTMSTGVCPNPPPPTARSMPVYTYDPTKWTGYDTDESQGGVQGYNTTDHTYTGTGNTPCTNALNDLENIPANDHTPYVFRIDAVCDLKLTHSVTVRGDLAIITSGGFSLSGSAAIQSANGAEHDLYLMAGMPRDNGSPGGCTNGACISFSGSSSIGEGVNTLIYAPAVRDSNGKVVGKLVDLSGGAYTQKGQVIAGLVKFSGGSSLTYDGMSVPGLTDGPFKQDIAYIREIVN